MERISVALALVISFWSSSSVAGGDTTNDPADLKRTWEAAHVYLPAEGLDIPNTLYLTGPGGLPALRLLMRPARERGDFERIPDGRMLAVVIYLHECMGITNHNEISGVFLAGELGIAVIQPLSFAREYRVKSPHAGDHGVGELAAYLVLTIRWSDEVDSG